MTLIDTHCHLNMPPLGADPEAVLARAAARGVTRVIVPAYDQASWPAVLELTARPGVYAALGIHPWVAGEGAEAPPGGQSQALAEAVSAAGSGLVAIGEIGLDNKIENANLPRQLELLNQQLDLAVELDLPVILHCRGAFEELLTAINHRGGKLRGVLHAFSRSTEVAHQFIKAGFHLGLGGAVTRPGARRVRKAATAISLECMVLETDAPSIGLDGVLPTDTEPHHVADVSCALAELRGEDPETIARQTTLNAERLFRIS
jgi:TatD DNase family protein|nr:TatD family hydrolase [Candidatus Krumholzibacteria bacterium]